jgi:hypothetical protein
VMLGCGREGGMLQLILMISPAWCSRSRPTNLGPLFGSTEIRAELTFSFTSSQQWILFVSFQARKITIKLITRRSVCKKGPH